MATLPSSLALTNIASNANILSADHRNNYSAIQIEANALLGILDDGVAGQVFKGAGTTVSWDYPPGYQFDYKEFTSSVSVTGTSAGTADTVVAGNSVTFDGSAVWIEFWCYGVVKGTTVLDFELFLDATDIGDGTSVKTSDCGPISIRRRYTPGAGAHTVTVKAYVDAGTGTVRAGLGAGAGIGLPGFLQITKA